MEAERGPLDAFDESLIASVGQCDMCAWSQATIWSRDLPIVRPTDPSQSNNPRTVPASTRQRATVRGTAQYAHRRSSLVTRCSGHDMTSSRSVRLL